MYELCFFVVPFVISHLPLLLHDNFTKVKVPVQKFISDHAVDLLYFRFVSFFIPEIVFSQFVSVFCFRILYFGFNFEFLPRGIHEWMFVNKRSQIN